MNKKTALITGSSRGIGRAIAILFARNNYNVVINYNKSEKEAQELYDMLSKENLSVRIFKAVFLFIIIPRYIFTCLFYFFLIKSTFILTIITI